jgi:hypothetical protein
MDSLTHRERQCAAPARRATEAYREVLLGERNAAGVDAVALECHGIYGTVHYISLQDWTLNGSTHATGSRAHLDQ